MVEGERLLGAIAEVLRATDARAAGAAMARGVAEITGALDVWIGALDGAEQHVCCAGAWPSRPSSAEPLDGELGQALAGPRALAGPLPGGAERSGATRIALPLALAGEPIGVLALELAAGTPPGLDAIAHACAIGIELGRQRTALAQCAAVREAVLALDRGRPLSELLQQLVAAACALTCARYGALGVLDPRGDRLAEFVHVGLSDEEAARIGQLPHGHGLLGAVIRSRRAIRVDDLGADPRASGLPAHHPRMRSFLGVPLRIGGDVFGNFYLCDREGDGHFTAEDQELVEQLAAQASLFVAAAMRIDLVTVVAHDLKHPATTIQLWADAFSRRAQGDRVTLPLSELDRVRRNASHLAQMIHDLLDAARVDVQRLELAPVRLDLAAAAQGLLARLEVTLAEHPVSLDAAPGSPRAWFDPGRFDQVLTNLLGNAVRYSAPGRPIRVVLRREGAEVRLSVEDAGIGIEAHELPRIFERFFRTPAGRAAGRGLGLGLFIARALVEAHGGRLTADSEPGRGSTFHVILPAVPGTDLAPREG